MCCRVLCLGKQAINPTPFNTKTVVEWVGRNVYDVSVRTVALAHISSIYWMQQIGVLLVHERAKVGSAVAKGNWPTHARRANAVGGVAVGEV
jgi:hypothetical protein